MVSVAGVPGDFAVSAEGGNRCCGRGAWGGIADVANVRCLIRTWNSGDAKAKFCELIRKAEKEGPQVVTRRGVEAVVVLCIDESKQSKFRSKPGIKKLLIEDGPKFEKVRIRKSRSGFRIAEFGYLGAL